MLIFADHATRPVIPVELVFNPNWWNKTAGISFDQAFYLDPQVRIENDVIMRRVLYQRYGSFGLGELDPQPRPVIGSPFVAGGFVIPALLGAEILFSLDAAPQPRPLQFTPEQIDRLEKPDFRQTWPMNTLIAQMDILEAEWGYLVGDVNTDGLLNAAYHLYGVDLFTDFYTAPERLERLLSMIGELIGDVSEYIRQRTGSCSVSVNRMIERVDRSTFLHANCSVPMISPGSYRAVQLPIEQRMAQRLQPFGIHHCGDNLQRYAPAYAELPVNFIDVGWGSDVAACRQALPDAFFNLRLSPVRMLICTPAEIAADTKTLLEAAGTLDQVGICCINMDFGTPDENLRAMYDVVQEFRGSVKV
ncbi:MAG: uroporphyrinogen decarboxylase family protein [Bellilinea sp.]